MPSPSRRDEILEKATSRATELGLEGVSIGLLAKELRMSKSGLISHFDSKEGLQIEVLQHAADRFTDEVLRPALKQPRGEPRLRAVAEGWLNWLDGNSFGEGCLFVAAATELDDRTGPVRDKLVQQQKDLGDTVANVVRAGVADGHFRDDVDPRQVAFKLKGILLAHYHSSRLLRLDESRDQALDAINELIRAISA